jgi:hypothetical protein
MERFKDIFVYIKIKKIHRDGVIIIFANNALLLMGGVFCFRFSISMIGIFFSIKEK